MASLKAILSHHLTIFTTQNPSKFLKPLTSINPSIESDFVSNFSSIFHQRLNLYPISLRPFSSSAEFEQIITPEEEKVENSERETIKKKPLDVFFKEAVGVIEKNENVEENLEGENGELKKRLKKLEDEVRSLKEQREIERRLKMKEEGELKIGELKMEGGENGEVGESKPRSLFELFAEEEKKDGENSRKVDPRMEDPGVYRELSPDMIMFVTHLYKEGYFKNSNVLPGNRFAIGRFETSYARDFVKFSAEKFGNDHQEIAKWLTASDLKKVALFGCPSLAKRNVFFAKRLRAFFKIPENTVCDRCVFKNSCRYANQDVWKGDTNALRLGFTMRLITLYALESVPPELFVTEDLKSTIGRLLKEAVNLSKPVKKPL